MKHKKLFILPFASLVLSGCSYNFSYTVAPYPYTYDLSGGQEIIPQVDEDTGVDDSNGTYNIKIWCDERIKSLTELQVSDFIIKNADKNYNIKLTVDTAGEDSAASDMISNVSAGADIFVFAQDQLSRLKIAGALSTISGGMEINVKNESEPEAIEAASLNGKLLAFPFTSDNGYFMYYNKDILSSEDVKDMDTICSKLRAAGKTMNFPVVTNGWYTASYFMATGCHSEWTIDEKNHFRMPEDNYNSQNGFDACVGIRELKKYSDIFSTKDITDMKKNLAVCVSGIWDYEAAYKILGDKLGCCQMPSFKCGDKTYHLSSYMGYKLIGVKPNTDAKKQSVCKRLARFLSSQTCQTERFDEVSWGPTNIIAMQESRVLKQPGLNALREQRPYAKPQTLTPSNWFSGVSAIATAIKPESTDEELWAALRGYEEALPSYMED